MSFENHPIQFIKKLVDIHGSGITFEFSKYVYIPQKPTNPAIFQIKARHLSEDWLENQLNELKSGENLSLHSRVLLSNGTRLHIPMIDFSIADPLIIWKRILERSKDDHVLFAHILPTLHFYASGRSMHAYSTALIPPQLYQRFLSQLLLWTYPGEVSVVDHRWVAHRINVGYMALRWSRNGTHYLQMPTFSVTATDLI